MALGSHSKPQSALGFRVSSPEPPNNQGGPAHSGRSDTSAEINNGAVSVVTRVALTVSLHTISIPLALTPKKPQQLVLAAKAGGFL